MKATPTRFNGVLYRSKSEARLAVCFDHVGWNFEYEPKIRSMPNFRPDFLLRSKNGSVCVIEYKPIVPTKKYITELNRKFQTLFRNNERSECTLFCELWCVDFYNDESRLFCFQKDGMMLERQIPHDGFFDVGKNFRFDLHETSQPKVDISKIAGR